MVLAHLHRIDPDANMARYYCVDIAPTLFGDVSVLRTWGRIGNHGRTSIEPVLPLKKRREQHRKPSARRSGGAIGRPASCRSHTLRCEVGQAFR